MPRWGRIAPGAYTLAHYERGWLRGDGLAGVTVCAYLIPQVMAYAEIAGLPAVTGLWAMCAPLATNGKWSCGRYGHAAINAQRWANGSEAVGQIGDDLEDAARLLLD